MVRFFSHGTQQGHRQSGGFLFLKPETFEKARATAPGWDVYQLEREWREWYNGPRILDS